MDIRQALDQGLWLAKGLNRFPFRLLGWRTQLNACFDSRVQMSPNLFEKSLQLCFVQPWPSKLLDLLEKSLLTDFRWRWDGCLPLASREDPSEPVSHEIPPPMSAWAIAQR